MFSPLLFCLCEEKNFGGSSTKLAPSQTGTNICRRNQLLSSVWTLNSLKWNIAFTESFFIAVTVSKLLVITRLFAQRQQVLPFYIFHCGETFSKLTVRRKLISVNLSVNKLVGTSCVFSDQPTKGLKKQPSYICLSLYFLKFEIL